MKKILKFFGISVATIIVLLMVLPFAFRGKIESVIKSEGNKLLNAQFDFESLDISLLRRFPLASVLLNDFWLKGVGVFENDTLVRAGELTAAVNIRALFNGDYEVSKIIVDDTHVKAIVLEDGRVNWDVMKPSDEPAEEQVEATQPTEESGDVSFKVALKKLSISDFSVVYDDRQGGMYASVQDFDATCSGDFGSDMTTVKLSAQTPSVTFRMGGVPFLSRAKVKADMDIAADLVNQKFTLNDNELQLNAIRAAIDGWVALNDKGMDMDLKLNTNDVGFKELLSLIPAIYAKDFEDITTDGVASLTAYAKGSLVGEDTLPAFDVALNVKDAMFRYPSLPAGVDAINIAARVMNPGGSVDATTVSVNPFNFTLAGNPFSMTADVKTPISDPDFKASAKGKIDLGMIKDVYPLEDMNLNGVVNADMSVAGRLSYIEKEQFEKVDAKGSISLSDMKLQMKDIPDVEIERSTFSFNPSYLALSQTTINIGENDLTLDSRFENYLGYLLKGSTIKGTLNVSSNKINLNDFMSSSSTESAETEPAAPATEETPAEQVSTATGGIRVPGNIDFRAQVNMNKVTLDKISFSNIKGLLVVKNSKVDMQNISLNTMGGSVVANGYYDTPVGEQPRLDAGFALNNISFAEAYRDLNMVQQLAPIFSGLTGNFSGSVKVNTLLDDNMNPVLQSLNGSGSLSTKDLSLGEVKAINMVADILKKPSLKDTRVKDLAVEFAIKDGRVETKPFDIKLGDYTMRLSGSTGLDQTIDYRGTITIPESAGAVAKLGTVDMTIGGTFTSPKVGIDLEGLAKQAAQKAVDQVKEQAEQKVQEVKDQVKEQAEQKVQEVKQQAQEKAQEAVQEVKQQAQEKAQEAAKSALSNIGEKLGASATKQPAEAADSTATSSNAEKATNAIGKAIDLFKKKK